MSNGMPERRDFARRIHQLFQQWRKGHFDAALVEWCLAAPLLQGVVATLASANVAKPRDSDLIKLFLAWTVESLRPPADVPPTADVVRDFTILWAYYRQGDAAKTVYQALGGTESTFRTNWCKEATAAAADLLYERWHATVETPIGQQWQLYALRHQLPPALHPVLYLLTVSTTPWSAAWLRQLPLSLPTTPHATTTFALPPLAGSEPARQALPITAALDWLVRVGWLPAADDALADWMVALPPALRAQLHNNLTPEERQNGHRLAAHCALLAQDGLTAAWHWLQAGEAQAAIHLLLEHSTALFAVDELDNDPAAAKTPLTAQAQATLAQLLDQAPQQAVDAAQWGQIKRLRGRIAQLQARQLQVATPAERAELFQRTLTEYQEALHFLPQGADKAAVHYQLAELAFALDSALAEQHLRQCIELLTAAPTARALLVRAYIKRAWLAIQQRPDLTAAEASLKHARLLLDALPDRAPILWSDWYNAWGTLYFCKGEFTKGVDALAQGIALLREQPNQARLCMMLHNQGLEFSTRPQGEQQIALHYLQQSLAIAVRINHVQLQMLCYKAIGGCYFHLQQYDAAIHYYNQAYALIPADSDFKVHLCYDLAEAHILQVTPTAAITYFHQGLALAHQMALQDLIAAYHDLAAQSPWLWIDSYKPRMDAAIRLLLTQGQLKSQEYAQAATINEKTALKDLQSLVAQTILLQAGKARATTYTLNTNYKLPDRDDT